MDIQLNRADGERERFRHPHAQLSLRSRGRRLPEPEDPIRTSYERDAHRILHAKPFRRLRNKTQVFFSPENDHIATRMDHSLFVATISQTICRALSLNDDLAFAIALGHDLGHAPFGHSGEKVLEGLLRVEYTHEAQSLRVVDLLSTLPGHDFAGMNLTYEVRDGIRCHCGETRERVLCARPATDRRDPGELTGRDTPPATLEGCVVRMVDQIAYLGRDYEDAQTALAGQLPPLPEPITTVLGTDNRTIINRLATDLIRHNLRAPAEIGFSAPVFEAMIALKEFNYRHIYYHERLEAYRRKVDRILTQIFEELFAHLSALPPARWAEGEPCSPLHLSSLVNFIATARYPALPDPARVVVDYLSLMTDGFAFKIFESIALPTPVV